MADIKYSQDFLAQQREVKAIRKDIATAYKVIAAGLARYRKKMLHAKNKAQTEDMSMFAELEDYESKKEIHDAFGWSYISEKQMKRLNDLWDAREQVTANQGKYADRVTEILERAMANCGDIFFDALEEFDKVVRMNKERILEIERENSINSYNRYHAGMNEN
jgi:homoserine dehydrogenase